MIKLLVFVCEQVKFSVLVLFKLYLGCMIDCLQVQVIGYLVLSSVLNLLLVNVMVVDQFGCLLLLLFQDIVLGFDLMQLSYVCDVEQGYIKCIEVIFGFVVGEDNVCVQVMVDVDLDNIEQMVEIYCFNQDLVNVVVCSMYIVEVMQNKVDVQGGVFGVLFN